MAQPKIKRLPDGRILVERFTPVRRVEHLLTIATVGLLFLTGLPQKFDGPVAAWFLSLFGGLDDARMVHRVAGIVLSVHAVIHLATIAAGILMGVMRLSLLPTLQDLRDARQNLLYYLGFRKEPAQLPKFDYRQKFEYIGMVFGGLVMVVSGIVLLFPQWVASVVPGELVPAMRVMHTNEAVLAFLVLLVWHLYGSHLSPDVFPMDKSIFTGYVTLDYLEHHHHLEYLRLFPQGFPRPEAPAVPPAGTAPSAGESPPAGDGSTAA